ncbi:MAG: gliding motility lipoprotein GldH [Bacteroidales bacterium]|nr:gliding motility lipoprotein GldH [Bacteroidales bacterium]
MKRICTYIACLVAAILMSACDNRGFYDENRAVDEHGWAPADSVAFDVPVSDTLSTFNFLVEVRNSVSYPYSNTFFFLRTTFPDGSMSQDTLEFPLADPTGRWLGKRTGRYVDTRFYFRRNARFPMEGTYRFSITNGMRDSAITGLRDVGFRIEYNK